LLANRPRSTQGGNHETLLTPSRNHGCGGYLFQFAPSRYKRRPKFRFFPRCRSFVRGCWHPLQLNGQAAAGGFSLLSPPHSNDKISLSEHVWKKKFIII
jgi:hypothetical protein